VVCVDAGDHDLAEARLRCAARVPVGDLPFRFGGGDAGKQRLVSGREGGPARDLGRADHVFALQQPPYPVQPEHLGLAGEAGLRGEAHDPQVGERQLLYVVGHCRESFRTHLHEEEEVVCDDRCGAKR
jgi:hypothetical protein